jgi:hypothetical protein
LYNALLPHWNDSVWQNYGQDTSSGTPTEGSITVNNVSNFSPFTFGSTSSNNNPLPVELTSFTAEATEEQVLLEWRTTSETQNRHFVVQRRSDESQEWKAIGTVPGNGTTLEPQAYQFIDRNPEARVHYYRLKQVDYDGAYEYSNVRAVELGANVGLEVRLGGNPVENRLNMALRVPEEERYQIRILNSKGQTTYQQSRTLTAGAHNLRIPVYQMAAGIYILRLEGHHQVVHDRVMVK